MQQLDLGEAGRDYLTDCLGSLDSGLSEALKTTPSSAGFVYTPAPDGATLESAIKFSGSGLVPVSQSIEWLSDHVLPLPSGYIILQDIWADSKYVNKDMTDRYVISDSSVYYYLRSRDFDRKHVDKLLWFSSSFLVAIFYIPFQNGIEPPPAELLSADALNETSKLVREIYVNAYDQEGFVVWARQ